MFHHATHVKNIKLNLNDINVNCYTAGEVGTPIILLHGAGVDSARISWGDIIEPLSKNHLVFAPDLPGYGQSDRPDVEYSLSFYVDMISLLMNTLNLKKASLVGLSLGGGISLAFTLQCRTAL